MKTANEYFKIAYEAHKNGEFQKARDNYEKAIELKSDYAEAYYNLAILLKSHFKEYDLARINYEKVIELKPDDAEAYYNLALLFHLFLKKYNLARTHYEKAIELKPDLAEAYNGLALLFYKKKKYDLTREYFEKAIEIKPDYVDVYYNLATILRGHFKEYDLAKKNYEKVIEINPEDANAYNGLAIILFEHFKEFDLAERHLKKAIDINPSISYYHSNLGELYSIYMNEPELAKRCFSKALNLDPENDNASKLLHKIVGKEDVFIKKIEVNNVHGLTDRKILINETEKQHLLITGDNGYFKTSILEAVRDYIRDIIALDIDDLSNRNKLQEFFDEKDQRLRLLFSQGKEEKTDDNTRNLKNLQALKLKFESGEFLFVHLPASRKLNTKRVESVEKITLKKRYEPDEKARQELLPFLVDLDYTNARGYRDRNQDVIKASDEWMDRFKDMLKVIFDDENIKLKYETAIENVDGEQKSKHTFYINTGDHQPFDFTELAHGYNSLLSIVAEILLRSTKLNTKIKEFTTIRDVHGIALIDEPETHLHVKLQRKIMPMLAKMFPRIQFVVATHSPFVLNSMENAVVYDVKKDLRLEGGMAEFAYDSIVEQYFDSSKYSEIINKKFEQFERLIKKEDRTDTEESQLFDLKTYFDNIPAFGASEIIYSVNQLKLKYKKR